MKYTLIYAHDPANSQQTEDEVQEWIEFDNQVKEAGIFVHEAGFHPGADAKVIEVRDGDATVDKGVSGVVAAGFYVLDVPDEDTAVSWAQRIPTARYGRVEVRQVVEF
ncbi:hypothetical protein NN3_19800 [Nocardia neocaledoniensis NBRC 108232]|uniref:YCII-related domain-containing protein n=1 Tax=Nocardia neocaledoniensis TaxID=236511 RepID=A0A317NK36_9NOCA|nr:YciI family protein [Nocardia neocaledoniensis]PWV74964.1 hypothetical protein DFR69_10530 [Nocardia neocaledoniensis]GEM30973.1 hypothetical protein NN3_19800 [Nocardia neocaledoniensis NBRC 108232]